MTKLEAFQWEKVTNLNPSKPSPPLKVHKREKFFVSDFEFFITL
jgi:hypothetical protein